MSKKYPHGQSRLNKWSISELRYELNYQNAPGEHTRSTCDVCNKNSRRGYGPCPECIETELKRREKL